MPKKTPKEVPPGIEATEVAPAEELPSFDPLSATPPDRSPAQIKAATLTGFRQQLEAFAKAMRTKGYDTALPANSVLADVQKFDPDKPETGFETPEGFTRAELAQSMAAIQVKSYFEGFMQAVILFTDYKTRMLDAEAR